MGHTLSRIGFDACSATRGFMPRCMAPLASALADRFEHLDTFSLHHTVSHAVSQCTVAQQTVSLLLALFESIPELCDLIHVVREFLAP
mmetsp:Transcript_65127/g.178728  ORF Transcript_65127/g.178728 Transcript_65127/m.178728 type:complete len:88 (+) Transcript_65127:724-987(+)